MDKPSTTPSSEPSTRPVRYRLLATLGRGGMADVYLAAATGPGGFNKLVVIKKMRSDDPDDADSTTMFLDEARLAARLNHPNIVHTYEVETSPDGYMLVMEYLEGQTLRRLAQALRARDGAIDPMLAAYLVSEALEGLHYVHEMRDYDGSPLGIVHRDVSPHNLFVTYEGQIKVLDFGIAKGALNVNMTSSGVIKGKVSYMAPEQVRSCTGVPGSCTVDRRADIFSAGVVLWEMLTGTKLFKGEGAELLQAVLRGPIAPPSSLAKDVPAELDRIVVKALARPAADRFETALAMSKALSELVRQNAFVRRDDVALRMQELFGAQREAMAKTVQAYMESRTDGGETPISTPAALPTLLVPPPSGSSPHSMLRSLVPLPPASFTPQPHRERASRANVWSALLLTLGAVGALLLFVRARAKPPTQLAASAAPAMAVALPPLARPPVTRPDSDTLTHLTLSSDPPEADVEWGGSPVGQTPLLVDLPTGPQTFVLSRDGYFKATLVLQVTDGMVDRSETRTVVLTPRPKARAATPPLPPPSRPSQTKNAPEPPASAVLIDPFGDLTPSELAAKTQAPVGERTFVEIVSQHPAPPSAPPPPPTAAPAVLSFGSDMTRPTLLSSSDLRYPREAIAANVTGTAISKCTITTEGTLQNCRILKGLPFLDKAILEVLGSRRYTPVIYQGKAVSVEYIITMKVAPPSSLR